MKLDNFETWRISNGIFIQELSHCTSSIVPSSPDLRAQCIEVHVVFQVKSKTCNWASAQAQAVLRHYLRPSCASRRPCGLLGFDTLQFQNILVGVPDK